MRGEFGGTGPLPPRGLAKPCQACGFEHVRTFLAGGNALFRSDGTGTEIRAALKARLRAHAGRPIGVLVRTAADMADTLARNRRRRAGQPGDGAVYRCPAARRCARRRYRTGRRADPAGSSRLLVFHPDDMARTRLRLPADRSGTARNMNTVARPAAPI